MRALLEDAKAAYKAKFTPGFYHGSPASDIKAFDPEHPASEYGSSGNFLTGEKEANATFLTKDPRFANSFLPPGNAYGYKPGSTVYPVSANLGKHFDYETPEGQQVIKDFLEKVHPVPTAEQDLQQWVRDRSATQRELKEGAWSAIEDPAFQQHLIDTGHDSFALQEAGRKNVGIFNPANIRGKFAKYNPEEAANPDFMKAEGGPVQSFAPGGLASVVKYAHGQIPEVAKALEEYLKGNISQADRIRIMNEHLPIRKWADLPPNYSDEQIRNALMANKQAKALADVPAGMRVGNRLDIPAYTQHGVYVDTTHDLSAGNSPISYNRTGHLTDVDFSSKPNQAVRVGLGTKEQALTPMGAEIGSAKSPFALIKGTNVGTSDDEVRRMMAEMMQDPAYTQIGMDPRRHSQFYDKSTGLPVWSAEEKLQSGPLIIAPKQGLETTSWGDPRLNLSDFEGKKYAPGGKVLGKLAHAVSVPFTHFSHQAELTALDPLKYGTGMKGAEAARLANAADITPRSYFYHGENIVPESGVGGNKYSGVSSNSYPISSDPANFYEQARTNDPYLMEMGIRQHSPEHTMNNMERMIRDAGYSGYHTDNGTGVLFHDTPVTKVE
jgi:hypothetical protein